MYRYSSMCAVAIFNTGRCAGSRCEHCRARFFSAARALQLLLLGLRAVASSALKVLVGLRELLPLQEEPPRTPVGAVCAAAPIALEAAEPAERVGIDADALHALRPRHIARGQELCDLRPHMVAGDRFACLWRAAGPTPVRRGSQGLRCEPARPRELGLQCGTVLLPSCRFHRR
jgi:hypothetical protein